MLYPHLYRSGEKTRTNTEERTKRTPDHAHIRLRGPGICLCRTGGLIHPETAFTKLLASATRVQKPPHRLLMQLPFYRGNPWLETAATILSVTVRRHLSPATVKF